MEPGPGGADTQVRVGWKGSGTGKHGLLIYYFKCGRLKPTMIFENYMYHLGL